LLANRQVSSHLNPAELDTLFDPLHYLGVAGDFIDRVIAGSKLEKH